MYSKMLVLRFPKTEVEKPIVCYLASDFNLTFNILKATILPRKEGVMVMELSGTRKDFKKGVQYLKECGVQVQAVGQDIKRNTTKCTHCGACTAVCFSGALDFDRETWHLQFDPQECVACGLCAKACPLRLFTIEFGELK